MVSTQAKNAAAAFEAAIRTGAKALKDGAVELSTAVYDSIKEDFETKAKAIYEVVNMAVDAVETVGAFLTDAAVRKSIIKKIDEKITAATDKAKYIIGQMATAEGRSALFHSAIAKVQEVVCNMCPFALEKIRSALNDKACEYAGTALCAAIIAGLTSGVGIIAAPVCGWIFGKICPPILEYFEDKLGKQLGMTFDGACKYGMGLVGVTCTYDKTDSEDDLDPVYKLVKDKIADEVLGAIMG